MDKLDQLPESERLAAAMKLVGLGYVEGYGAALMDEEEGINLLLDHAMPASPSSPDA